MKLQTKIFIPVILSLVVLGGSMYLLNKDILKDLFYLEVKKALNEKERLFKNKLKDKEVFVLQYANILSNSKTIRSVFLDYNQSKSLDSLWYIINTEVDRIKYQGYRSGLKVPPINCHTPSGNVIFRSRSAKRGDNVIEKRKIIARSIVNKESVSGIEIGKYGLDVRGVSPVLVKKEMYGTVEAVYPLSQIIDEINTADSEAFALFVNKEYASKITVIDSNVIEKHLLENKITIQTTNGLDVKILVEAYKRKSNTSNIVLGERYNHVFISIENYNGDNIATLAYQMNNKEFVDNLNKSALRLFVIGFLIFILSIFVLFLVLNRVIINPVKQVTQVLHFLSKGIISEKIHVKGKDEVGQMQNAINVVNKGMRSVSDFAVEIGNEKYENNFEALSEDDELGNTMLQVRDKLKEVAEQEKIQTEIEKQRNWTIKGEAKFATLLQKDMKNMEEYTYSILENLISYLDVNQGAIFLFDSNNETLRMSSSYAYDRRKFIDKEFNLGEGLIGNTAIEKKLTYLTDIPQDYIAIKSGLGYANPTSLIIVPLIADDELLGVFELASFRTLQKFEIDFCDNISKNIAQAISRLSINHKTNELLEQSKQQSEELSAQEEEMRQNLEEMQATQDDMTRKDAELEALFSALNVSSLVVEFDLDRNIVNVNDRILKVFGITSKKEIVGKNHKDFYYSEGYEERASKLWGAINNKEVVKRRAQISLPNGESAWLQETYSPILDKDGEIMKVLNISTNITSEVDKEQEVTKEKRKIQEQADARMKESLDKMLAKQEEVIKKSERNNLRNKSQLEIMNATALVSKTDLKGNIIYANELFCKTCGYSQKELVGVNHNIVRHPDMTKSAFKNVWDTIQAGKVWTGNVKNKAKNGDFYWVYASIGPVFDEKGEIIEYIALRFLITDYIDDKKMVAAIHKAFPDTTKISSKKSTKSINKKVTSKKIAIKYNPSLIKELKQEHQIVSKALVEIQDLGIASEKGIKLLQESKEALLGHLTKEDEQLYPTLHKMAETDPVLKSTLETFATEMEGITKFVLDFYQKYAPGNSFKEEDFKEDVSTFIVALTDRVIKEESIIYKQYRRFNKK